MAASSSLPARRSAACCSPRCSCASGSAVARRGRGRHRRRSCGDRRRVDRAYRCPRRARRSAVRDDRIDVRRVRHAAAALARQRVLGGDRHQRAVACAAAALCGIRRVRPRAAFGLGENALQALGQGMLAGPAAMYLFAFSIQTIGVARAAVFPATVPALTILKAGCCSARPRPRCRRRDWCRCWQDFISRKGSGRSDSGGDVVELLRMSHMSRAAL